MLISLNDFCRELMLLKGPTYTLYFFSSIFLIFASLIIVSLMILSINNNAVISLRIADEIGLNENEPYVEILEVLQDSIFVAKRAKMFEEEKKVASKAPVNNVNISDLNIKEINTKNELSKKFSYEIKIADFYFNNTASLLVDRIIKETKIKHAKIKKINEKKYRVYAGPFNNINSLQKSFNDISILEFENIEIIKND